MGPTTPQGQGGSSGAGGAYAPGAGANMSQQAGATTETLGMVLAFVTEFNANTQIFVATTMLMLGILSQQDANLRMLEARANGVDAPLRNLEGRVSQMGHTPAGADNTNLRRDPGTGMANLRNDAR